MIPVHMAEKKVYLQWSRVCQQAFPQRTNAGARVENDQGIIVQADFNTRGVAAIPHSVWSRYRNGATCPPKGDLHSVFRTKTTRSLQTYLCHFRWSAQKGQGMT